MKQAILALLLLCPFAVVAQLQDNFSDGDFTQNPAWAGDAERFVVNPQGQLQSNGPAATGTTLQLVTASEAVAGTVWEFWANLKLATSSANYADVYLIADAADLNSAAGYFVRLGGTPDEVSLFRKDSGKAPVYVINGEDKTLGGTDNVVRVRVSRSVEEVWHLEIDLSGTGQQYVSQGTATDGMYTRSLYFGVVLHYSSANSQKFFFDDFTVTDAYPPAVAALQTTAPDELSVAFTEPLAPLQAENVANYTLNGSQKPVIAELTEAGTVRLVFSQPFKSGENTLRVANLADLYGNTLPAPLDVPFAFVLPAVLPGYNQLLITEIMADETPVVGLPAQEYIELYNPTAQVLSLKGIRYSDATSTTIFPDVQLLPQEYVVVVPNAQVENFRGYGQVIGISNFPSLNNSGELLQLHQPNGRLIYAVQYSDAWYKDPGKREGGWSLEMIDVTNPCGGIGNWTAAAAPRGGTPAQPNSVAAANPDHMPPALESVAAISADKLQLRFNERLDSVQAAQASAYTLNPTIGIAGVEVQGPLFSEVILTLAEPLQERQLYTLTATGLTDCSGNLSASQHITFALPSAPLPGDVVINEVLFNPRPGGADFVELVNRSDKYLDLKNWQLANTSGDSISNRKTITATNYVLEPGQYVVLTTNPENIRMNYPAASGQNFLGMSSLPTYPDAAGTVVVLQADGHTADRFAYSERMHFALLDDKNGVSLERLRLDGPTQADNFHSAATTVFATPGYKNSQSQGEVALEQIFKIAPLVFSPDGDGYEDFTTLNYSTSQAGFVATITVFDAQGREIRKLARNELLAANGFFQWDGLRQDGTKASIGYYLFYIELFDLSGQKREYKKKVVVGGRL
ncbi:lamin tail domain-containing protein [Pontibacter sp. E15-1]|uniref:lamin tail domain-containing protein n=1 Tax=Pontibacter sp. E15-1 TaxID=2919918 RepID=UPI001F4F3522|nr:lamin tail domain-containing protein [Pontibacter sp. E15-1]MCJ8166962.1 lamin tail domain-containing protein [Pontibacter sp. E15-1]